MFVHKETGAEVRLAAQDERGVCHFNDERGAAQTLPSHEFFAAYREPKPAELAAYNKANPPPPSSLEKVKAELAGVREQLTNTKTALADERVSHADTRKALKKAEGERDAGKTALAAAEKDRDEALKKAAQT